MKVTPIPQPVSFNLEVTSYEARILLNILGRQSAGGETQQMFDALSTALDVADRR